MQCIIAWNVDIGMKKTMNRHRRRSKLIQQLKKMCVWMWLCLCEAYLNNTNKHIRKMYVCDVLNQQNKYVLWGHTFQTYVMCKSRNVCPAQKLKVVPVLKGEIGYGFKGWASKSLVWSCSTFKITYFSIKSTKIGSTFQKFHLNVLLSKRMFQNLRLKSPIRNRKYVCITVFHLNAMIANLIYIQQHQDYY